MKKNLIFLIAEIVLFIAILKMPYGYYQLLRWVVCAVGIYGAYLSFTMNRMGWVWTLGIIALVFNPLMRFHFDKDVWKVIDLMAGVLFCIYFVMQTIIIKKETVFNRSSGKTKNN